MNLSLALSSVCVRFFKIHFCKVHRTYKTNPLNGATFTFVFVIGWCLFYFSRPLFFVVSTFKVSHCDEPTHTLTSYRCWFNRNSIGLSIRCKRTNGSAIIFHVFFCHHLQTPSICWVREKKQLTANVSRWVWVISLEINAQKMSLFSTCIQKHAARTRDCFARKLVESHFSFRYVNCAMQRKKNIKICAHTKRQWNWPLRPNRPIWKRIKYDQNIDRKKIVRLSFFHFHTKGENFSKSASNRYRHLCSKQKAMNPMWQHLLLHAFNIGLYYDKYSTEFSLFLLLLLLLRSILFTVFVSFFLSSPKENWFQHALWYLLVAHLSTTKQYQFITNYRLQENVSSLPISSALPYGLSHCATIGDCNDKSV